MVARVRIPPKQTGDFRRCDNPLCGEQLHWTVGAPSGFIAASVGGMLDSSTNACALSLRITSRQRSSRPGSNASVTCLESRARDGF